MQQKPKLVFHNSFTPQLDHPIAEILLHFKRWLKSKALSTSSVKNYLSDTRQFLKWLSRLPQTSADFLNYSLNLQQKNLPWKAINRRLASLRQFACFLHQQYALPNFKSQLQNIPQDPIENLIKNFHYHLKQKRLKSKTITNYLSDIKHYLVWANNNN